MIKEFYNGIEVDRLVRKEAWKIIHLQARTEGRYCGKGLIGPQAKILLCSLAIRTPGIVTHRETRELLWPNPDNEPKNPSKQQQIHIHNIRKQLPKSLVIESVERVGHRLLYHDNDGH